MKPRPHDCPFRCPVDTTIDVIGGRWKAIIVFRLLEGTKRFGELKRFMPDVTQRMLTLQLRELESDGIVDRRVYKEVPPKVEYSLTEFGRSLDPVLQVMCDWGKQYNGKISELKQGQKVGSAP